MIFFQPNTSSGPDATLRPHPQRNPDRNFWPQISRLTAEMSGENPERNSAERTGSTKMIDGYSVDPG
jgi:hypothetical protein